MILAMLLFTARALRRRWATAVLAMSALASTSAEGRAQGPEGSLLPSGGGTFIPYGGGPGGGLGVMPSGPQPRSGVSSTATSMGSMSAGSTLGVRPGPSPLRPIGASGGMGGGSSLVPRTTAAMKAMPRPPVGSYPFRIPPSLRGGASQRPSMAM